MHNLCILLHIFGYCGGVSVCICITARSELRRRPKNEKIENRRALSEKQIQFSPVLFLSSFPVETRNSGYNCDLKKKLRPFINYFGIETLSLMPASNAQSRYILSLPTVLSSKKCQKCIKKKERNQTTQQRRQR